MTCKPAKNDVAVYGWKNENILHALMFWDGVKHTVKGVRYSFHPFRKFIDEKGGRHLFFFLINFS